MVCNIVQQLTICMMQGMIPETADNTDFVTAFATVGGFGSSISYRNINFRSTSSFSFIALDVIILVSYSYE